MNKDEVINMMRIVLDPKILLGTAPGLTSVAACDQVSQRYMGELEDLFPQARVADLMFWEKEFDGASPEVFYDEVIRRVNSASKRSRNQNS